MCETGKLDTGTHRGAHTPILKGTAATEPPDNGFYWKIQVKWYQIFPFLMRNRNSLFGVKFSMYLLWSSLDACFLSCLICIVGLHVALRPPVCNVCKVR